MTRVLTDKHTNKVPVFVPDHVGPDRKGAESCSVGGFLSRRPNATVNIGRRLIWSAFAPTTLNADQLTKLCRVVTSVYKAEEEENSGGGGKGRGEGEGGETGGVTETGQL